MLWIYLHCSTAQLYFIPIFVLRASSRWPSFFLIRKNHWIVISYFIRNARTQYLDFKNNNRIDIKVIISKSTAKYIHFTIIAWKPYIFQGNKMRFNNVWGPRHCPNTFCNNSILTSLIVKPFEPILINQKCNEKQACSFFIVHNYSIPFLMAVIFILVNYFFLTVKTISYHTCKYRPTCITLNISFSISSAYIFIIIQLNVHSKFQLTNTFNFYTDTASLNENAVISVSEKGSF